LTHNAKKDITGTTLLVGEIVPVASRVSLLLDESSNRNTQ
jgi:hypothetical protein